MLALMAAIKPSKKQMYAALQTIFPQVVLQRVQHAVSLDRRLRGTKTPLPLTGAVLLRPPRVTLQMLDPQG